ncbi:thermonuclease family protein [Pseudoroseomonas cervicalis]|uniref:thermonuclease family protein n=1 Tax=Teichococcus cervicalis TaxID=204525 RepID=UPI00277D9EB7|nr:thermonuclease family protein [Pseudoroseomonas cervicalis]MDQ1081526.1 endonuclease YncB(thermonuclease family) [Pseudoroseomonas cervicalis]
MRRRPSSPRLPRGAGRRAGPWAAVALVVAGLLGAGQVTEADWMRLGTSLWRAITAPETREAPRRAAPPAEPFSGRPRVIDGDTLDVAGIRVRMQGIDAFESDQQCSRRGGGRFACGAEARDRLAALIDGREITCTPDGTQTHGRSVAVCTVRQGGQEIDLNAAMVRSGLAFDCPRYSRGRYAEAEAEAKEQGAGAWGGRFAYPWSHRDRSGACGR